MIRLPPRSFAAALAVAGCASEAPTAQICDATGTAASHASAEGRWVLGRGARYPADLSLASRVDELRRSQRARRTAAWQAVARAFAPVPLAQNGGVAGATVPRFRTWYDREDVMRTFQRLYGALTPEARRAGQRFTAAALDEAFGWNVGFVETLPEWTADRLARFASSFDSREARASITGLQRIGMSPDAVRHAMQSYPEVLRCMRPGGPPPETIAGLVAPRSLAREALSLAACATGRFGPWATADGGSLTARVEDADAEAQLAVIDADAPNAPARCTASARAGCTARGGGNLAVRVTARGFASAGTLDVRYTPPEYTACVNGVFPAEAATVAQEWRRAGIDIPFPVFDTSAEGLRRRLAADATWGDGDRAAEPDESRVYTMRRPTGAVFRLAAMHIRTREVDNWMNITLWWSPDPDTDFGADRPESVRALGAPWNQYKMCVATDFAEHDPDPEGGYGRDHPTLAAALRAVYEGAGAPSWCSNPYIDAGPGLVRSNCVGCHQHALSGVRPADVQTMPARYPSNGRTRIRNNVPADGFWAFDAGDELGAIFAETAAHFGVTPTP